MRIQHAALLCVVVATSVAKPQKIVSWSEIRQAIEGTICFPVVEGKTWDEPTFMDRGACGAAAAPDSVSGLVDGAIKEASPVLVRILGYERERDAKLSAIPEGSGASRNATARKILLDDPSFVDPIISRVVDALAARGETCPDCPTRSHAPSRAVASTDVKPYALSFVFVDPVHTVDSDGRPLAQPKLSFHICTGLNTVATLPHDERLARAGYVATHAMSRHAVGEAFGTAMGEDAFGALKDDAARTEYLRRRVTEQLDSGPDLKATICAVAPSLGRDLSLIITDCPGS